MSAPPRLTPARRRFLVVSVHDVSPRTGPAVRAMLADLRAWGVGRTSLLVVPDHHRRGHFLADPAFCRELERWAAGEDGHEIVIHGYYHQRPAAAGESSLTRWITGTYTAGEGEFYDLPAPEAAARLARAQTEFAQLRLPAPPTGFIAPAWLLGAEAAGAVRGAGFAYTTRLGTMETFTPRGGKGDGDARTTRSQSLVWSCRNAWRRAVSLAWNAALAARLRHNPLLRIGLHPPDREHPAVWRQIERLTRAALSDGENGREVTTYGELAGMKDEG